MLTGIWLQSRLVDAEGQVARLTARLAGEEARADEAVSRMHANDAALRRVQATADEAARAYANALADLQHTRDEAQRLLDDRSDEADELHRKLTTQTADLERLSRRVRDQEDVIVAGEDDKTRLGQLTAQIRKLEDDRAWVPPASC